MLGVDGRFVLVSSVFVSSILASIGMGRGGLV
jgi:hypothetical protein